jgi:drug/metabolite transporter (DMT)-like permease
MAYFYLLFTFCVWGSLYVVSKFLLGKIPVLTISLLRYVIAGTVLFFILKMRKPERIEQQDRKYVFLIGFVGYFLSMGAQLLGTKLSNASLGALLNSLNPVSIMVFAAFILKEQLTVRKVVGIILSIAGVYTIIGGVDSNGYTIGILLSLFSGISWSYVSVAVRRITQKYDPLQITTYGIIVGAVCTLPFSLVELMITPTAIQFDWLVVCSLLYIGLVCTALAHVLWNRCLSMIEAGICSSFYPLQSMTAVLLGWLFLGESIDINFLWGAMLIVAGVMLSIKKDHSETAETVSS